MGSHAALIGLDEERETRRSETARVFASMYPGLSPGMLFPRLVRRRELPFPFNDPAIEYFYYCRAAIYELARVWNLSGQEVLFPAYCCGVELRALRETGVQPRFYPVHQKMNVDPDEIAGLITARTRAVYLTHFLGFPGPVAEVKRICATHHIRLIEDCALSLFSSNGTVPLGSYGDAAVFSIHKWLPIPAGGALVLRDGHRAELRPRRRPSLRSTAGLTFSGLTRHFSSQDCGWGNSLLTAARWMSQPIKRAAGGERIEVLTDDWEPAALSLTMSRLSHLIVSNQNAELIVSRHRQNYLYLEQRLARVSATVFPQLPPGVCPLYYPALVPDNRAARKRLLMEGLETGAWWSDDPSGLPAGSFPEVDRLRRTVLALPCHEGLSQQVLDRMAECVSLVIQNG
jgi:perosamine synthetase